MSQQLQLILIAGAILVTLPTRASEVGNSSSLPALQKQLQQKIAELTERIERSPQNVELYSQRGAAYFQLGDFASSLADFDKMIELEPSLATSHWRRGITLYYLGDYKKAARQFEIYHTYDNVDRENGIWRFLCQAKAYGIEKAREGLLKYEKDDRAPFPSLYEMFAGRLTGEQVIAQIESANLPKEEYLKQRFYADLYVGLYAVTLEDRNSAVEHLRKATVNSWGQRAGGGPGYMHHVARIHYELLNKD